MDRKHRKVLRKEYGLQEEAEGAEGPDLNGVRAVACGSDLCAFVTLWRMDRIESEIEPRRHRDTES